MQSLAAAASSAPATIAIVAMRANRDGDMEKTAILAMIAAAGTSSVPDEMNQRQREAQDRYRRQAAAQAQIPVGNLEAARELAVGCELDRIDGDQHQQTGLDRHEQAH